jgi:hypothetical protein
LCGAERLAGGGEGDGHYEVAEEQAGEDGFHRRKVRKMGEEDGYQV